MNYLAHALLAGPDPQWVLGSYLGDHVRGDRWRKYPPGIGLGIVLHRKIDVFTDAHPAFIRGRRRLDAPFRRYAGIIVDVLFDHFLSRDFKRLTGHDLPLFACLCYATLDVHQHLLPDSLRRFARYQRRYNLLVNYANRDTLQQVFDGIASRMRRPGPLSQAVSQLDQHRAGLETDFLALFDDLRPFARERRRRLRDDSPWSSSGTNPPRMDSQPSRI